MCMEPFNTWEYPELSNSKGWLEFGVYITYLVGEREGEKGH